MINSKIQLQSLTVSLFLSIFCCASAFAVSSDSKIAKVTQLQSRSTIPKLSQSDFKEDTATTDKIERINGSGCMSQATDLTKKKNYVPCHHVVITTNDSSLNFHFDVRDETVGVSYIVENKLRRDDRGRTYYLILGTFRHENGKSMNIVKAEGICSTDLKVPEIAVGCNADISDGTSIMSVLNK